MGAAAPQSTYYALWDVGCVWKITVMGSGHHLEEIGQPLEVIGDILAGLIKNLNAGGTVLFQSEYVALCIGEAAGIVIKAIGLGAGGQRAQTLAGAGTDLNGLVQSGAFMSGRHCCAATGTYWPVHGSWGCTPC